MNNNYKNDCAGLSCIIILIILCMIISYYTFGIIFLINDFDISSYCYKSYLWIYVIVSILISFFRFKLIKKSLNNNIYFTLYFSICLGIFELGLIIWGYFEILQKSCNDLSKSNIWIFALISFCLQIFSAFLLLIIFPILFCRNIIKKNELKSISLELVV